jgi:uncharacterized heparinase superfamily protein
VLVHATTKTNPGKMLSEGSHAQKATYKMFKIENRFVVASGWEVRRMQNNC